MKVNSWIALAAMVAALAAAVVLLVVTDMGAESVVLVITSVVGALAPAALRRSRS